ncbi:MAG: amino acid permease [Bacteroidetes bacterium]|nr:amino acid permease [Bacteroidota bacterium]
MKNKFSLVTATSVVIANMVGTGVFTSLGFQVMGITSGFALLMLWLLGGVVALCGAFAYSELSVIYPRSGGEYHFLSKIYHPALGFLAGWISITVGFAAPVAAAAIAFGHYFSSAIDFKPLFPHFIGQMNLPVMLSILLVLFLTLLHGTNKKMGAVFQNVMTVVKVSFIILLFILGLIYGNYTHLGFHPDKKALKEMISPAFAISMYFVSYSYSGWNAAAYILNEIRDPLKNTPKALITGTGIVVLLYMMINFIFLFAVPIPELAGKIEVGYVFAQKILGHQAGTIMGLIISFLLISSVSSMIIVGPRVYNAIGEDYRPLRWLSLKRNDVPYIAIIFQSLISIFFILTSTFEQVIIFVGFTLNLFTFLTVLGVFVTRIKKKTENNYKAFGYPWLPGFFLLVNLWILVYGFIYKPHESIAGILIAASGYVIYFFSKEKR